MVADEPYQKHISQAANNEEVCIITAVFIENDSDRKK